MESLFTAFVFHFIGKLCLYIRFRNSRKVNWVLRKHYDNSFIQAGRELTWKFVAVLFILIFFSFLFFMIYILVRDFFSSLLSG